MVECQLPKLNVEGSIPFARSKSPIQRLAPSIQQGKNHLEDEKFLSMVMGKLRAIAHFDGI